eukprot:Sspe_Gene.6115::Locus_2049_Transcript_1_1_Confidence_1.000_Length_1320::g.6115::m.6115/K10456/KLHL19, KEAP1, INRF2; kelch-like protein 19
MGAVTASRPEQDRELRSLFKEKLALLMKMDSSVSKKAERTAQGGTFPGSGRKRTGATIDRDPRVAKAVVYYFGHRKVQVPRGLKEDDVVIELQRLTQYPQMVVVGMDGDTAKLEVHSKVTNSWKVLGQAAPREHAAAAVVDGRVYVIGGKHDGVACSTVECVSFEGGEAKIEQKTALPTPRYRVAVVSTGSLVIVAGGCTRPDTPTNAIERYDPAMDRWRCLPPLTKSCHSLGIAAVESKVFVSGGVMMGRNGPCLRADVEFLCTQTYEWRTLPGLPEGRAAHAMCVLDNHLYVVGGYIGQQPWRKVPRMMLRANLAKPVWEEVAGPQNPRLHASVVVVEEKMVVVGGLSPKGVPLASVEVYDPVTSQWTEMPHLSAVKGGVACAVV